MARGRSGPLSQKPRRNTRRNNLVRLRFSFRSGLRLIIILPSPFPAVDTPLPASELIADSVKRSSCAHVFYFYALLSEIVSVPRRAPRAWMMAENVVTPSAVGHAGQDDWRKNTITFILCTVCACLIPYKVRSTLPFPTNLLSIMFPHVLRKHDSDAQPKQHNGEHHDVHKVSP